MELSIDTSTRYASVALSSQGKLVAELAWHSKQNHSVECAPAIQSLMGSSRVAYSELEAIFVARGPGGFSALRVGMSLAKALAVAQAIPLTSVGTLDLEAHEYLGLGLSVCSLIGAGRNKVYAALFTKGRLGSGSETVYQVLSHQDVASFADETTLFCGEAAHDIAGVLRDALGAAALIVDTPPPTRRPAVLALLGYRALQAGQACDPATLQPTYMRGSQFQAAQRTLS